MKIEKLQNFYFTFGTDPAYPYGINDYVQIKAENIHVAQLAFQREHPNRSGSDCYNYAFDYDQDAWNDIKEKYYKNVPPVETIVVTDEFIIDNETELEL